jgi:hypothetical protein
MPNIITCKLDVTLIDKKRLFQGRKKNRKDVLPQYLDLVLIPTRPTQYGDQRDEQTHMVLQSVTKEERDKGIKGEILGNAVERIGERDRRAPAAAEPTHPADDGEDSEIPF